MFKREGILESQSMANGPSEIIEDWITVRPQDFAKGFVSCWKAWRQS